MRISLILLFNCFSLLGFSQRFEGAVIDSVTHQPIPYVHVYSNIYETGTITNEEGKFLFTRDNDDSLEVVFSHIGFKTKKIILHKNQFSAIILAPNVIVLHEIEVDDRAFNIAKSIFQKFISNRPISFGKAFYRQVTTTGGTPSEFFETFNNISFSAYGIEKYATYESRYARVKESTFENPAFYYTNFSYLTFGFQLFSLKAKSIVKPFTSDYIDLFDYYISKGFRSNGCEYAVIHYEPSDAIEGLAFAGEFTVNITKQSILTFMASTNSNLGIDSLRLKQSENNTKILITKDHLYQWVFRFNDNAQDSPLESINVVSSFDLDDGNKLRRVKTVSTLIVFEKDTKKRKGLKEPVIQQSDVAESRKRKHNAKFWKDNPIIRRTDFEDQTISYFEKSNSFGNYFND